MPERRFRRGAIFTAALVETISGSRRLAPINRIDVSNKLMHSL